jgi:hypothetical protein
VCGYGPGPGPGPGRIDSELAKVLAVKVCTEHFRLSRGIHLSQRKIYSSLPLSDARGRLRKLRGAVVSCGAICASRIGRRVPK